MICPKCKGERVVYHRNFESIVMLVPCPVCNGTGEVAPIVQKFKKPHTNFQRITESPEKLAKFLGKWFVLPCELCEHFRYDKCTAKISERHCDEAEAFEKWLNEESKE